MPPSSYQHAHGAAPEIKARSIEQSHTAEAVHIPTNPYGNGLEVYWGTCGGDLNLTCRLV